MQWEEVEGKQGGKLSRFPFRKRTLDMVGKTDWKRGLWVDIGSLRVSRRKGLVVWTRFMPGE